MLKLVQLHKSAMTVNNAEKLFTSIILHKLVNFNFSSLRAETLWIHFLLALMLFVLKSSRSLKRYSM